MSGPWIDTHEGKMWTYHDPDRWGRATRSVRNDALWEAMTLERTAFVNLARSWALAAVYDGWSSRPTYEREPIEQAFTLEREGFKVSGIARPGAERSLPCAELHIWGPDRLAIAPPLTYDWAAIQRGFVTCSKCKAHPVDTVRVGFAGRYCAPCAEIDRPLIETPGWAE